MEFVHTGTVAKAIFKEKQESVAFLEALKSVLFSVSYEALITKLDDGTIIISVNIVYGSENFIWKKFLVTKTGAKLPLRENFYERGNYLPDVVAYFNNLYDIAPRAVIGDPTGIFWLPVHKNEPLVECQETEFKVYQKHSFLGLLYDLPSDTEPEDYYFINEEAYEAYYGHIYSKDFGYFYCDSCERDICFQNPRNGYQTNYATVNGELICNECYKSILLTEGVKRVRKHEYIPGTFIDSQELIEFGWQENSTHFVTHSNVSYIKDKINNLLDSGKMATVQLNTVGLGCMEGTMTIWSKDRDS